MTEDNEQKHGEEKHEGGSIVDTPRGNMSTEQVRKQIERQEQEQKTRKTTAE